MSGEDTAWQRLDKWLWHARFQKHRADCARLVETGGVRVNRQSTDKPHAKLRVGDVLTLALGRDVRVLVVQAFAARRGPADAARLLYREIPEGDPWGCGAGRSAAYRPSSASHPSSASQSPSPSPAGPSPGAPE